MLMSRPKSSSYQTTIPLNYFDDSDGIPLENRKRLWAGSCRYDVVIRVAMENKFLLVEENDLWHISWTDLPVSLDKIADMKRLASNLGSNAPSIQKLNHFPGMFEICRKDRLGRNLNKLHRAFPKEYDFYPPTWDLPSDITDLMEFGKKNRSATYIIKPESGSQGKGIFLVKNLRSLCPFAKCVCQLYIPYPFLLDGYKFDQRIYVLLTCVDPLRVYIYNEGIARFATVKYQAPHETNLEVTYMHLTNYSLNKFSDSFDPEKGGTKRKLSQVYKWMRDHGYDVTKLQSEIDDMVVKTVICVAPTLRHSYRTTFPKREKGCHCFEVLGFDILIDRHMKPILLEVNHAPSFNLDTQIDHDVKFSLMRDVFAMIYLGDAPVGQLWKKDPLKEKFNIKRRPGTMYASPIPDALKDQFAHEENNRNGFRLLLSEECPGKYARFMDNEYFKKGFEESTFLRKRPEPFFNYGTSESARKATISAIQKTQAGNLYVETMPAPSRINDNQNFLKFKFNTNLMNLPKKPFKPPNRKPLFEKINPSEAEREVQQETMLQLQNFAKCDFNNNTADFTPTQRVQFALQQLRKKNVEKFKMLTLKNTHMFKNCVFPLTTAQQNGVLNFNLPFEQQDQLKNENFNSHASGSEASENLTMMESWLSKIVVEQSKKSKKSFLYPGSQRKLKQESDKDKRSHNFELLSQTSDMRSFRPSAIDIKEESRRRKMLHLRKKAINVMGIGETAKQILELIGAPDRKEVSKKPREEN